MLPSAVPYLIAIVIASNIGGTATLIGPTRGVRHIDHNSEVGRVGVSPTAGEDSASLSRP